jgi:thiosulfate reductase / polysulfide reductase chain A
MELHPDTARALGITAGDHAWVETPRGKLRMKVRIHERIHPKVVAIPHGWWLPEAPAPLHGIFETCSNVLTDDSADVCDVAYGSSPLKGLLCRVYPERSAPRATPP